MSYKKALKLFIHLVIFLLFFGLTACSSFKGTELDYEEIPTSTLNKSIKYGVYTPPNWTKQESLPLVLFLHGARDDHNTFEKYNTHSYFDKQINVGKIPRFILITPNGDVGFWENWKDGTHNYRDWVIQDILPKVQRDYNTLSCPRHCSLMGISMGGFGALRIASFHKDKFSKVSAISSPVLSKSDNQSKVPFLVRLFFPLERIFGPKLYAGKQSQSIDNIWADKNDLAMQKISLQLVVGDKDRAQIMNSNRRFHELLLKTDRKHEFHIYKGGHKWIDWIPNFNRVINFLVK